MTTTTNVTKNLQHQKDRDARYKKIIKAANKLADLHVPYQYGGGHQTKIVPDKPVTLDCSSSVCYVLQHAGYHLDTTNSTGLLSWGKPGKGKSVTVWANKDHTFLQLGNRFFGTTKSHPNSEPGWIDSYSTEGFTPRHPIGNPTPLKKG